MAKIQTKNHIYVIISLVGLFLIGGIFGYTLNGFRYLRTATMTEQQCNVISTKMIEAVKMGQTELIKELNNIYSENCIDREFLEAEETQETACKIFENIKNKSLHDKDSYDYGFYKTHLKNAEIYATLFEKGCKENSNKYKKLALRELEVVKSLQESFSEQETRDIVKVYKILKMRDEFIKEIDNMDIFIDWVDGETEEEYNIRLNNVKKEMKNSFNG